jgi:hypothetical protein
MVKLIQLADKLFKMDEYIVQMDEKLFKLDEFIHYNLAPIVFGIFGVLLDFLLYYFLTISCIGGILITLGFHILLLFTINTELGNHALGGINMHLSSLD